ncbi:MAG: hypothetical protein J0G32_00685 [Alphaproteobacteria bacterium]|nr:hypothetical protein [Alphaproteobacteria bacterium]OJV14089.1 MAG: hypothetical protein BGO27_01210 [Alphaproteobacteria bacterium 33-17]
MKKFHVEIIEKLNSNGSVNETVLVEDSKGYHLTGGQVSADYAKNHNFIGVEKTDIMSVISSGKYGNEFSYQDYYSKEFYHIKCDQGFDRSHLKDLDSYKQVSDEHMDFNDNGISHVIEIDYYS